MSKYGIQPAREMARAQRWSISKLAEHINVPPFHLRGVLLGHVAASMAVRDRLPAVLGQPLSKLFTADMLAARYHAGQASRSRVRPGQSWPTSWDEQ